MGQSNRVYAGFLGVTVVKIVAVVLLGWVGVVQPFVGANAYDHYLVIAKRLWVEGRFNGPDSRPDSKVPLGYPVVLAPLKGILPGYYLWVLVGIQMIVDLLVACCLYRFARDRLTPAAGVLAGLAWLLFPPALAFSTWVTSETIFTALLFLSVCLLVSALERDALAADTSLTRERRTSFARASGLYGALAAGLVLGGATLFRGTCVWLPVFFLPLWLARGWSRRLLLGLAFAGGVAAVVGPWAVRNRLVLDDPILVSVGAGSAFLQGSDERVFTIAGKQVHYPALMAAAQQAGITRPTNGRESAMDGWMLRVGLHNYAVRWHERPWTFLPFGIYKLLRMWYGTESGDLFPEITLAVIAVLVVPLGLWQIWNWRADQPVLAWVFGLVVVYFIGLHTAVLPEYRYMHPVYPFLILAACGAAVSRWQRRPRPVGKLAGVAGSVNGLPANGSNGRVGV